MLRVESPEGRLRAVVFGYACHNTTLGFYQWCGDYAGFAQEYLEAAHQGTTALFFMGCGADANPLPRRTVELCQKYGRQLADAVEAGLAGEMHAVTGSVRSAFSRVDLPLDKLPTREELAERAKGKPSYTQRRASWLLNILDEHGKFDATYPYPIQVWQLGSDLTWVALGGEAVVDYSHRLKRELGPTTWVASYANDVMEYIPSLRVLKEGENEAEIFSAHLAGATWAPPVEELIVGKVHELVTTVRGAAETPPAGYQLAWSDEFDGATLDLSKWSYRGLGRRHDALNVTDAVLVGGGQLTIATYASGGKHYTGMIGTEGKFERRFGYWEACLRFEGAPGMWSAFWIQTPTFGRPPGDPATAGMEIDVIEHRVSDKSGQVWGKDPARNRSWIGYATSQDGVNWTRMSKEPVLTADSRWEKNIAVMCPHVIWDEQAKVYRMWYSGGEQYEPNAIGYATSPDGLKWTKHPDNPIFTADKNSPWEQHKVTACQVIREGDWHLMFYIGFADEQTAQIGVARSRDGITGWERHPQNPIIRARVNKEAWDYDACYKPYAIFHERRWLLWYNGRKGSVEQIGLAIHEGVDLEF